MMDLSTLMQSTVTPYLLLIVCEDNQQLDEETKDVIRTVFDTIKNKPNIKILRKEKNQLDATYFIIYSILIDCSTCFGR